MKSLVIIDIKTKDTVNKSTEIKVGIGILCGVAALAAVIVGLILLRRRKLDKKQDLDDEQIEIRDATNNSIVTQNPLMNFTNDDDPFEDEFNDVFFT